MTKVVPGNPNCPDNTGFWRQAIEWKASVSPRILPNVLVFTALSVITVLIHEVWPWAELAIGPLEAPGAVLGLVLVFRINAGYDRWWEARKLWGGIVNQSRNLSISALAYGPRTPAWKNEVIRWTACFSHAARITLRGEKQSLEITRLVGVDNARQVLSAPHPPSYVSFKLASLLNEARESQSIDGLAFIQVDKERAYLIEHIGACERILKTPIPRIAAIKIRRFIVLILVILPFALVGKVGWYTPAVEAFICYQVLALELIGRELQNPYSRESLSHLPLNEICAMIERNLMGMLESRGQEKLDGHKRISA